MKRYYIEEKEKELVIVIEMATSAHPLDYDIYDLEVRIPFKDYLDLLFNYYYDLVEDIFGEEDYDCENPKIEDIKKSLEVLKDNVEFEEDIYYYFKKHDDGY